MSAGEPLSQRALNRALLARQGLLARWDISAFDAIERLVGMQSQAPNAPYVGLWSRLTNFNPDELSTLMLNRSVVRIALLRSTIFLVSSRDALALRPVVQPCLDRGLATSTGGRTEELDLDRFTTVGRRMVEERPRTFGQLGELLAPEFAGFSPGDLANTLRCALALVQVTPRGVWGQSKAAYHTTIESWLGQPLGSNTDPDTAIRRYLTAFGPATVADIQAWCGLTGLRPQLERMRPTLHTFTNERGQELFDVPDGLLPDPETPVPVRILAEYDNILLSHADRSRIFTDQQRMRVMTINGIVRSTFLIDGFARGTCAIKKQKSTATVTFTPFDRLLKKDQAKLAAEGRRLLRFSSPETENHLIEFAESS
jgi:hypothetical protein